MERDLNNDMNNAEDIIGRDVDLDEFDLRLDELKDSIKKLKKIKKKHEKYIKLEEEKESILKKLERNEKGKKHRHK
jgi:hypothetical protein